MGVYFETLVRSNFILEHRRRKWTKNEFLMVLWVKYIILKKIKISAQRPLNARIFFRNKYRSAQTSVYFGAHGEPDFVLAYETYARRCSRQKYYLDNLKAISYKYKK